MVIRTRLRAILFPILLYAVSGTIAGYFVWTAVNGQRACPGDEQPGKQLTEDRIVLAPAESGEIHDGAVAAIRFRLRTVRDTSGIAAV